MAGSPITGQPSSHSFFRADGFSSWNVKRILVSSDIPDVISGGKQERGKNRQLRRSNCKMSHFERAVLYFIFAIHIQHEYMFRESDPKRSWVQHSGNNTAEKNVHTYTQQLVVSIARDRLVGTLRCFCYCLPTTTTLI